MSRHGHPLVMVWSPYLINTYKNTGQVFYVNFTCISNTFLSVYVGPNFSLTSNVFVYTLQLDNKSNSFRQLCATTFDRPIRIDIIGRHHATTSLRTPTKTCKNLLSNISRCKFEWYYALAMVNCMLVPYEF